MTASIVSELLPCNPPCLSQLANIIPITAMPNIGKPDASYKLQLIFNCKFINIKKLIANSKCITSMVRREKRKILLYYDVSSSKPKSLLMFLGKWDCSDRAG